MKRPESVPARKIVPGSPPNREIVNGFYNNLVIIPARGGSKGVPKKNIRLLNGKPLIAWTIETALRTSSLTRIVVSTDDDHIARIAGEYGAEIPFMRPSELAQDDTPDLPVYLHALSWLAQHQNCHPDIVVWLRPTSPLRSSEDIENAIRILNETGADCVRSVCLTEHHPYWMKKLDGDRLVPFMDGIDDRKYYRRQLLPPAYRLNGAVEVIRCQKVIENGQLYGGNLAGYIMPPDRSLDLDGEMDFALAEMVLQRRET